MSHPGRLSDFRAVACLDLLTTACQWQNRVCFEVFHANSFGFEQNLARFCLRSLSKHRCFDSRVSKSDRLLGETGRPMDKNRIVRPMRCGELAQHSEAARSSRRGKCGGRAGKQRVLTWGDPNGAT